MPGHQLESELKAILGAELAPKANLIDMLSLRKGLEAPSPPFQKQSPHFGNFLKIVFLF